MAKNKILQTIVQIAGEISPTLGKSIENATDKLGGLNLKALAVGAAVGGIAVTTGKAVMEAGKYLTDLGSQFDAATDAIRIGTGATGEVLDGLLEDFDEIYKSVPTSMEAVSTAVADFNTRLGLSGPVLQELSKQAIQVSDMLGDDLSGVIKGSSEAFQIWNIEADKMSEAMDYVFKASQSTGLGFTDLMNKAQQFGPQLQELGYSFEESIALIGQLEKAGANTEEVLGAMKRSVGMLAKQGISASKGLQMYYEKIKNAGSAAEATAIANEIFGARAGSTMAAAIRDGTLSVAELTAQLKANGETISGTAEDTYDFAERLQLFKQQAEIALKPLANTMFDSLNALMPVVGKAMESLTPIIQQIVEIAVPLVEDFFGKTIEYLTPLLPMIVELGGTLLQKLMPPVLKIISAIMPVLLQLLNALMPILDVIITLLGPILDLVVMLLEPILGLISSAIVPLIQVISELINTALTPLGPIIEWVSGILTDTLGGAIAAVRPIIDSLTEVFNGLLSFLKNVFAGNWSAAWQDIVRIFGSIFDGIKALFKAPINFIIGGINSFIKGINKIKIPDWVPGVGGKGINIPLIPTLGTGGFTEGISIAGEAGTEAVISFDPAYRAENIGYWMKAGEMLGVMDPAMVNAARLANMDDFSLTDMTENHTVVYDLGGVVFAPQIEMYGDSNKDELIKKLKEHEEDFFDYLEEWLRQREVGRYGPSYSGIY